MARELGAPYPTGNPRVDAVLSKLHREVANLPGDPTGYRVVEAEAGRTGFDFQRKDKASGRWTKVFNVDRIGRATTLSVLVAEVALAYGTSIADDASVAGDRLVTVTNAVAFTIQNPSNPAEGREVRYRIHNSTAGAMGAITWGSEFRLAGAFVNPAAGQMRIIGFVRRGAVWRETGRTAADQAP